PARRERRRRPRAVPAPRHPLRRSGGLAARYAGPDPPRPSPRRRAGAHAHPLTARPLETTVSETITPRLVSLDESLGADKRAVIHALAARVAAEGRASDADALATDAWAREEKDETGLPGGI